MADVRDWAKRNGFFVAVLLVVIFGYSLGKDAALRDNARDATSMN